MMEITDVEVAPYFGSFILETLTLGMYQESRNAIREYVQNSYDSIISAREKRILQRNEGTITVKMEPDRITIRDDGLGMSQDTAVSYLTSIGASQKDFRRQAGFRGIGRLAGMVMCDELVFKTKAAGESLETRVVFDSKLIRTEMTPAKARRWSLSDLLKKAVTATQTAVTREDHYFQVELNGLFEAPSECLNPAEMVDFLGQVSPVDYSERFPFAERIRQEAVRRNKDLDVVTVIVETDGEEIVVTKPYERSFVVGKGGVELHDIEFEDSESGYWWGWVGNKNESGAYSGKGTGIRIRAKNIQIDGTQLMRDIFGDVEGATSYTRFNEWYVGEIFVNHEELIPNARRDGFEDTKVWLRAREELVALCKGLGKDAYVISSKSQTSPVQVLEAVRSVEETRTKILPKVMVDMDTVIDFSKDVEKVQRKISKAIRHAEDMEVASKLRGYETRLLKARNDVFTKSSGGGATIEAVRAAKEAEQKLLETIVMAFTQKLDPKTCARAMAVLEELFGARIYPA